MSEKQKGGEEKKEVSNLMVQKAMDYIALNYSEKISLKNIAEELYLSPNYLSELFKRHTDQNISEYITQFRLDKAKMCIRDSCWCQPSSWAAFTEGSSRLQKPVQ